MKTGDNATINFSAFGITSQENYKIIELTDTVITVDDMIDIYDKDTDRNYTVGRQFCRKTGKCLNDNNSMGAKRTLQL